MPASPTLSLPLSLYPSLSRARARFYSNDTRRRRSPIPARPSTTASWDRHRHRHSVSPILVTCLVLTSHTYVAPSSDRTATCCPRCPLHTGRSFVARRRVAERCVRWWHRTPLHTHTCVIDGADHASGQSQRGHVGAGGRGLARASPGIRMH